MDLNPSIWISSKSFLQDYGDIISVPISERSLNKFEMPDYFPRIKDVPLMYFSSGEIDIKNNELYYNAFKLKKNSHTRNMETDLSFMLNSSNIKLIEYYSYNRDFGRDVYGKDIRCWINVKCNGEILGGEFLIRADNNKSTKKLFKILNEIKEDKVASTKLSESPIIIYMAYISIGLLYSSLFINLTSYFYNIKIESLINTNSIILLFNVPILLFFIWSFKKNNKVQYHCHIIFITF